MENGIIVGIDFVLHSFLLYSAYYHHLHFVIVILACIVLCRFCWSGYLFIIVKRQAGTLWIFGCFFFSFRNFAIFLLRFSFYSSSYFYCFRVTSSFSLASIVLFSSNHTHCCFYIFGIFCPFIPHFSQLFWFFQIFCSFFVFVFCFALFFDFSIYLWICFLSIILSLVNNYYFFSLYCLCLSNFFLIECDVFLNRQVYHLSPYVSFRAK